MDMSPYRDLFVSESRGHLSAFSELLMRLEENSDDMPAINEAFRHAHSLKGMAATMGFELIAKLAHNMEDRLSSIRSGTYPLLPALTDLLLEGCDAITQMVSQIDEGTETAVNNDSLIERLAAYDVAQDGETADIQQPAIPPAPEENQPSHRFRQTDSFKSIRIKTETLDHLVKITGELITNRHHLKESISHANAPDCHEPLRHLEVLLNNLRDEVFKARMLPFSFIAERFPRLVRDLARTQGKEIHFQLEGRDIELDRSILEEIAEPIVHILRNAVDHGMETSDERVMSGKPFGGNITLSVTRDKDHIEITIIDDGRGMNPEKLKQTAVTRGIISAEQAAFMPDSEAYQLICKAGFSTAAAVTEISGRGVGMDAVRDAVHSLSGTLAIKSLPGSGSTFIMKLPTAVSIIHALLVRCAACEIAIPLNIIAKTVELIRSDLFVENGQDFVMLDGQQIPVKSLQQALALPSVPPSGVILPAVICNNGVLPVAFIVDQLIGRQEIFIRPLKTPLSLLHGINGATVTGDGRVVFVADAGIFA